MFLGLWWSLHLVVPPPKWTLCKSILVLKRGIDGPKELTERLCFRPVMEVLEAWEGIVGCPVGEAKLR